MLTILLCRDHLPETRHNAPVFVGVAFSLGELRQRAAHFQSQWCLMDGQQRCQCNCAWQAAFTCSHWPTGCRRHWRSHLWLQWVESVLGSANELDIYIWAHQRTVSNFESWKVEKIEADLGDCKGNPKTGLHHGSSLKASTPFVRFNSAIRQSAIPRTSSANTHLMSAIFCPSALEIQF